MRLYGNAGDHEAGIFIIPLDDPHDCLRVIASVGAGWEHVSVSLVDRCPTWDEMERIKRMFFRKDETAFQLHVPPSDHISYHPYCLHIWRPIDGKIPMPPAWMVGPKVKHGADNRPD